MKNEIEEIMTRENWRRLTRGRRCVIQTGNLNITVSRKTIERLFSKNPTAYAFARRSDDLFSGESITIAHIDIRGQQHGSTVEIAAI